jgi:ribonuclease-3
MKNDLNILETRIGHLFKNRELLITAMTHPSFRHEQKLDADNQRLEFLGDSILNLITAEYLFDKNPDMQEGDLSKLRSQLTHNETLAQIGADLQLGAHLRLGVGEAERGGRERPSNLADAIEAIIGASYLDSGITAARAIFRKLFMPRIATIQTPGNFNPKGALQEFAQIQFKCVPEYTLIGEQGPDHAPTYTVQVAINGKPLAKGSGSNKRDAEKDAARHAILQIKKKML